MKFYLFKRARTSRIRKSRKALGICLAALILTMVVVAAAPSVAAVPVFDGYNTSDWDALDLLVIDKCNTTLYNPGYDLSELWAHYDAANDTIFFRLDVCGCPGDKNDDCNDSSGEVTNYGVGSREKYAIWLDLENECEDFTCTTWEYYIYYTNNTVKVWTDLPAIGDELTNMTDNASAIHGGWYNYQDTNCSAGDHTCIVEFRLTNASQFGLAADGKCIPYTILGFADYELDAKGEDYTNALQVMPEANFIATTVCYCNDTQFTDLSIPGTAPLVNWSWDFDEDSIPDSYVRNATWHFSSSGVHKVTLIVTDEKECPAEITKEVTVDPCSRQKTPILTIPGIIALLGLLSVFAVTSIKRRSKDN